MGLYESVIQAESSLTDDPNDNDLQDAYARARAKYAYAREHLQATAAEQAVATPEEIAAA